MPNEQQCPVISVVVPVYHGQETLAELVERTDRVLGGLVSAHEILFIDDGSADDSWAELCRLVESSDHIRAFRLTRNFGQHNAIMCGLKQARGAVIVTLDDDLQNPPEEIPKLYEALLDEDLDVVYGYFSERRHSLLRNLSSNLSRWLLTRSIPRLHPKYSNYRAIRRSVIDAITDQDDDFLFIDGLITWVTDRTGHVVVAHDSRPRGSSNYTLKKLVVYLSIIVFTFTVLPLRVLAVTGSLLSLGGFAYGAWIVWRRALGLVSEAGFSAIIVSVLIMGGIQLLSLAVIGEYVGKIFLKQSQKPQFLVRETRGGGGAT